MLCRRFPEALRKFDQVLDITPDDADTIAQKAGIAQAQGDLTRAGVLLAPLHPPPDDTGALEIQVYQAILERRPAEMISLLSEMLANPDPALGYNNGELRFWLGWAQQVAGDHAHLKLFHSNADHPSARVEADLISTTGVPSKASIGPIFNRVPSIARTVTG